MAIHHATRRSGTTLAAALAAIALLLLAGCLGGPAAGDANASGGSGSASDDGEAAFTVQIEGGDRTVEADESGEATVELRYTSSGGTVGEMSWDAIETPSGSSTGVLDYDSYAELRLTGEGQYVVQLTATGADGARARDIVTITVE